MSECARFLPAKFTQRKHDMLHARRLLLRNLAQITPSSQISFTDNKQTLMGPKTKRAHGTINPSFEVIGKERLIKSHQRIDLTAEHKLHDGN